LTKFHAKKRLKFAQETCNINWKQVIFSDECSVERGAGKDAVWVFRYPEEQWHPQMIEPRDTAKQISQMIWGGFWYNGRSDIVFIKRDDNAPRGGYSAISYTNALKEGLVPIYDPGDILLQDNAPVHTASLTQKWLEEHGVWVLDFPPKSPDLNPIEHLWRALKREIIRRHPDLELMGESEADWQALREAIKEAWNRIGEELLQSLVDSMPRRLAAVRKAKGWQTRY
jgi:transposase